MTLGVIIGVLLLLLLIGLVVLQGMIEWGNLDTDKIFGKKGKEAAKEKRPEKKPAKKGKGRK